MNLCNTTGRKAGRYPKKETKKPGMFYIHELHDWIIGGNLPDERAHFNSSTVLPYQIMKGRPQQKRYF